MPSDTIGTRGHLKVPTTPPGRYRLGRRLNPVEPDITQSVPIIAGIDHQHIEVHIAIQLFVSIVCTVMYGLLYYKNILW